MAKMRIQIKIFGHFHVNDLMKKTWNKQLKTPGRDYFPEEIKGVSFHPDIMRLSISLLYTPRGASTFTRKWPRKRLF